MSDGGSISSFESLTVSLDTPQPPPALQSLPPSRPLTTNASESSLPLFTLDRETDPSTLPTPAIISAHQAFRCSILNEWTSSVSICRCAALEIHEVAHHFSSEHVAPRVDLIAFLDRLDELLPLRYAGSLERLTWSYFVTLSNPARSYFVTPLPAPDKLTTSAVLLRTAAGDPAAAIIAKTLLWLADEFDRLVVQVGPEESRLEFLRVSIDTLFFSTVTFVPVFLCPFCF
jgi:hypothetical protein